MKTLAKIKQDKKIGGVCSGFAYMLGVPTWAVRMTWALTVLFGCGVPIAAYLLLWIFMPQWHVDPSDYAVRTQQNYGDSAPPVAPLSSAMQLGKPAHPPQA